MIDVAEVEGYQAFDELRESWQKSIEVGRLEEAEAILQRALAWARFHDDESRTDSVVCLLAAIAIHVGRGDGEVPKLREILLRSSDPGNCRLAAYNISHYYELCHNYKKSLFYARIACERAHHLGRSDLIAYSRNQVGNALLGGSFVEEASREYEAALELVVETGVWRAIILDNLGYCRVLQKRFAEGYSYLYQSLRLLRRFAAERFQVLPHLDLCFTHLENGRYLQAWHQGEAAIRLAEKIGDADAIKNALYLLGETANLMGDTATAGRYFTRLQRDYFPESPYLPGFLLAVDVRKLVNLHA
jgi:tetratricopeptide (TPR) repeat protein